MAVPRARLWLIAKTLLAAAILVGVGLQFARILGQPALNPYPFDLRVGYLIPAGVLYLLAHCCWGSFWVRLLGSQGVKVSLVQGLRAYFVSQYGKYIPGKVWVVGIRVVMLGGDAGMPLAVGVTAELQPPVELAVVREQRARARRTPGPDTTTRATIGHRYRPDTAARTVKFLTCGRLS